MILFRRSNREFARKQRSSVTLLSQKKSRSRQKSPEAIRIVQNLPKKSDTIGNIQTLLGKHQHESKSCQKSKNFAKKIRFCQKGHRQCQNNTKNVDIPLKTFVNVKKSNLPLKVSIYPYSPSSLPKRLCSPLSSPKSVDLPSQPFNIAGNSSNGLQRYFGTCIVIFTVP